MKKIRLDTVCEITAGQGAPQGENSYSSEGIPFVKAGDLVNLIAGKKENEIQKVSEEVAKEKKLKLFPAGSVLFAKSGMSCMKGHVYQLKDSAYVVSHLAVIMPRNIDSNFLRYYFTFDKPNKLVQDAAYPAISLKDIASLEIPHPPLPDQQKIAAHLDLIQSAIDNKKQQLAQLDELVKSKFVEMFGENKFEKSTLANVCESIVDCPHTTPKYLGNLTIPAIRTSEISNGEIDWSSMLYVSEEEYKERTKRLIPLPGDVVYAREGSYGDCVILPKEPKFCLGQRTMLFRPNKSIVCSEYLHRAILSDSVKEQADRLNVCTTVPHVNVADAKEFLIPVPPIELQNTFAEYVQKIDSAKSIIKTQLVDLQELLDSKMDEYFGE